MTAERYIISVVLDSFSVEKSGDTFTAGEFYFVVNGKKFPDDGEIKLDEGDKFKPKYKPTVYWGIKQTKAPKTKLKIKAMEKDPGLDDTFLKESVVIDLDEDKNKIKIKNKNCKLKMKIYVEETDKW